MLNNVALDVVIGLVFVYLLYSLLATVLSEIMATWLGLRARNLKEAIDRMLNDEDEQKKNFWKRLWDSLRLMKSPQSTMVTNFYNNPEIKYLGSTGIFRVPSSFKAASFSKTLLYQLSGEGQTNKIRIEEKLKRLMDGDKTLATDDIILDKEAAKYVLSLWHDSYGDLVKFKLQLEGWFDRTMEQATEWYKRKIQIVLLVLGFCLAWFFNADTFTIISKLANDKDARGQMVQMASAYVKNNPTPPAAAIKDSSMQPYNQKLDSLLEVKKKLDEDIANANTILGVGGWLPDSTSVIFDKKKKVNIYTPQVDEVSLPKKFKGKTNTTLYFSKCNKWDYFFNMLSHHFFGFLITAIAISLGAPFWFDMLNKLMKLRTSNKENTNSAAANSSVTVSPLNREA